MTTAAERLAMEACLGALGLEFIDMPGLGLYAFPGRDFVLGYETDKFEIKQIILIEGKTEFRLLRALASPKPQAARLWSYMAEDDAWAILDGLNLDRKEDEDGQVGDTQGPGEPGDTSQGSTSQDAPAPSDILHPEERPHAGQSPDPDAGEGQHEASPEEGTT